MRLARLPRPTPVRTTTAGCTTAGVSGGSGRQPAAVPAWTFPKGDADHVTVTIETARPGESHDIQINISRLSLQAGTAYDVAFLARATAPRLVKVGCALSHPGWGNLGLYDEMALHDDWTAGRFAFVAGDSSVNARIHVDLGCDVGTVSLRNVIVHARLMAGRYGQTCRCSLEPGRMVSVCAGHR